MANTAMSEPESTRPPGAEWIGGTVPRAAHEHHAELWSGLARREAALVDAVTAGEDHEPPRAEMVDFLHGEVFAHLQTEELVLYNAARGVGAHALVATLELDHKSLLSLTEHIAQASTGLDAALLARALVMLFVLRMEKEETVLLPTLAEAGIDVSVLLQGRPEMLGTDQA
ncbi:hemerythrin domain-containing protein [Georgenia sp. TF02-10]|uniref:hemerythrin domain-containing protein n=1 Tax=Georgenia sp. TF02-10 TaxID=2917725 RepID=UPI001FA78E78|nr:hemerythrin domain-containing protein [Georgenia sp. TF02-10]UNX54402.1 hemerythrin domain-containing protein [Georgenia sp. TF02-10]